MAERTRNNEIKFILDEKWKLSELKSRSDFLRQLIIYGYVFDVNYDGLKEYNKELNAIGNNINQIVRLCTKMQKICP